MDPKQSREGKALDALIVICTTALAWVKVFDASIAAMILLSLVSGRNVVGGIGKAMSGRSDPPPSGGGSGSQDRMVAQQVPPTTPRDPGSFIRRAIAASVLVAEARNAWRYIGNKLAGARATHAGLAAVVAVLLGCAP